jgi:hypothetical protein
MKRSILAIAAVSLLAVAAFAAKPNSGLKPGANVGAFDVVDVNGPNKGKQLCYRCSFGGNPVVAAFIKPGASEAQTIVQGIQKLTDAHGGKLKSFVVFMAGAESKPAIDKMAHDNKISVPLTFLPAGTSAGDIGAYQINPEASSTVMLWKKGAVVNTFVNVNDKEWGSVASAAGEMLK